MKFSGRCCLCCGGHSDVALILGPVFHADGRDGGHTCNLLPKVCWRRVGTGQHHLVDRLQRSDLGALWQHVTNEVEDTLDVTLLPIRNRLIQHRGIHATEW